MKYLMALLLLLGFQVKTFSQLDPYQWRVGISGGYANYYGDLSAHPITSFSDYKNIRRLFNYNKNYIHDYSYAASLERRLSAGLGLRFSVGKYSISMSDRYINPNNILQLDAPNFGRSLNFKTEILDYGLGLILRSDNGKWLNKNSFMAPFLTFGMGWANFKVFGDLYDHNNQAYNYTTSQPVNDGEFETRLDRLNTELAEGYSNNSFYSNVGLGVRFRLGKQLELFAQSDFKHTYTDYLDDVSGLYRVQYDSPEQQYAAMPNLASNNLDNPFRGNSNGRKDWYIFHSIGIKLSFSPMKSIFRASIISPGMTMPLKPIAENNEQPSESADSLSSAEGKMEVGNNYFTFLQINQPYNRDSSYYSFKILEADVNLMNLENQMRDNENFVSSLNNHLDSLQSIQEKYKLLAPDSEFDEQQFLLVEKNIGEVEEQLQEALLKNKEIEAGLITAKQNKELYQKAYLLSQDRQGQSDSIGFVKEVLQLPTAVREALARSGSVYKIEEDSVIYSQPFSAAEVNPDGVYFKEEQGFRSGSESEIYQNNQNPNNQLYGELIQERARNRYLLRQLGEFSNSSYNRPTREDLSDYDERRNNSQPDITYRFNDYDEFTRRNRGTGYVLPIVVPRSNRNVAISEQKDPPQYINPVIIPRQLQLSSGLRRFSDPGLTSLPPYPRRSNNLDFIEPVEKTKKNINDASPEIKDSNLPVSSKIEIYFDNNQANPGEQELKKLLPLATMMKKNPAIKLTISGFADNTGNLGYNLNLINQRISHVKTFLLEESGISPEQINILPGGLIVRGKGQKQSPKDRKVEVSIQ